MADTMMDIEDFAMSTLPSGDRALGQQDGDPTKRGAGCSTGSACGGCSQSSAHSEASETSELRPITTSTFELFKIGIGPSSSHTVGPLVACRNFMRSLVESALLEDVVRVHVELCGSLALTGIGHYTNKAVVLGLTGVSPADVNPSSIEPFLAKVAETGLLKIGFPGDDFCARSEYAEIFFDEERDVTLHAEELPLHPNGMVCRALDDEGEELLEVTYYSIGGGFVCTEHEMMTGEPASSKKGPAFPFVSMTDLMDTCQREGMSIAEVMRRNEEVQRTPEEVDAALADIWRVMEACVDRGLARSKAGEELPGPLGIKRRAPDLYHNAQDDSNVLLGVMDQLKWLDCYALAVMEENACMGQVVTAPTNGASGVVPGMLAYYMRHLRPKQCEEQRSSPADFLLTAASVGIMAKERACISGAAGGCQAEVGTATAMAAAGLCAVLGGTPAQVEEAAEIAMEHSLGMTCDPVLGLVQVPCIERNAMGASKALNAVTLVMKSPSTERRSLLSYDAVLRVMKETGQEMSAKYRETAQGGLAADYEAKLAAQPEKWAQVQDLMGMRRVQVGPRRRETRRISYSESMQMRRELSGKIGDLGHC